MYSNCLITVSSEGKKLPVNSSYCYATYKNVNISILKFVLRCTSEGIGELETTRPRVTSYQKQ